MKQVLVIDYGMSNLLSITRAFEKLNAKVVLSEDPDQIKKAELLVLPGVGSFCNGIEELQKRDIPEAIHSFAHSGRPMLGICLGMQMMLSTGSEVKHTLGLNLIPGDVLPLPGSSMKFSKQIIPHIGWCKIDHQPDNALLTDLKNPFMYFVHSFYASPANPQNTAATANFYDMPFTCMINKENMWGTQFHPEKSGEAGLCILSNFIKL